MPTGARDQLGWRAGMAIENPLACSGGRHATPSAAGRNRSSAASFIRIDEIFMDAKNINPADTGERLLMLPGLICDSRTFTSQFQAFDRAIPATNYGDADDLAEMAAIVLANAPPRFALLGHSMGARVALEVVRRAPERV